MGILMGSASSHGGPVHHNLWSLNSLGDNPLDAQSAGLSCVGTCFQAEEGTKLVTVAILLPM